MTYKKNVEQLKIELSKLQGRILEAENLYSITKLDWLPHRIGDLRRELKKAEEDITSELLAVGKEPTQERIDEALGAAKQCRNEGYTGTHLVVLADVYLSEKAAREKAETAYINFWNRGGFAVDKTPELPNLKARIKSLESELARVTGLLCEAGRQETAARINAESTLDSALRVNAGLREALKKISRFFITEDGNCGGRAVEIAQEALAASPADLGEKP